jgi:hypothetical protein
MRPIRIGDRDLSHREIQVIVECLRAIRDINLEIANADAQRDADEIQTLLDEISMSD